MHYFRVRERFQRQHVVKFYVKPNNVVLALMGCLIKKLCVLLSIIFHQVCDEI